MKLLDRWVETRTRRVAQRTSRRHFVGRLGVLLLGGSVLPLLPVARATAAPDDGLPDEATLPGKTGDPTNCNYWRHCAIDGFPCACCGGSETACPPGTELSAVTWIGTCRNPGNNKDYIISYNDCCGKSPCGRCMCFRAEGDKPVYLPPKSNDINWCQGTNSNIYHCTISVVIGEAGAG
ncbi:MAG: methylamine dehydrogenase light chain [Gammaproteobacteria bacterium]|jgi:methylamine dehydrogenase light chain|nr:methylamine dehydrogenase light chain [Gammaproteobacteria bacterium]